MANPIVCNYHDVSLHENDAKLVEAPNWLNDSVISFYFEFLRQDRFAQLKNGGVLLVPPDTAFMLAAVSAQEAQSFLAALKAETYRVVLLPVNDQLNLSAKEAGGSHWSLLAYLSPKTAADASPGHGSFFHINSMRGSNDSPASKMAQGVAALVGARSCEVEDLECPQQHNSHDCGVYVLAFSRRICNALAEAFATSGKTELDAVGLEAAVNDTTEADIDAMRIELGTLIQDNRVK